MPYLRAVQLTNCQMVRKPLTQSQGSEEHWEDALAAYPGRSPEVTADERPFSLPGLRSLL